jgi:hypothetical protein
MSYHTHLPLYAKIYLPVPGSVALADFLLHTVLNRADLTLVTSPQLKEQVSSFAFPYHTLLTAQLAGTTSGCEPSWGLAERDQHRGLSLTLRPFT